MISLPFRCLGNVAVHGYNNKPDTDKYCCVSSKYTSKGDVKLSWDSTGSPVDTKVEIYGIMENGHYYGIEGGNFQIRSGNSPVPSDSYLLWDRNDPYLVCFF